VGARDSIDIDSTTFYDDALRYDLVTGALSGLGPVEFYRTEVRRDGGPVLELACGPAGLRFRSHGMAPASWALTPLRRCCRWLSEVSASLPARIYRGRIVRCCAKAHSRHAGFAMLQNHTQKREQNER
jgi:hypothetical protein